jgi:hypothetical protein
VAGAEVFIRLSAPLTARLKDVFVQSATGTRTRTYTARDTFSASAIATCVGGPVRPGVRAAAAATQLAAVAAVQGARARRYEAHPSSQEGRASRGPGGHSKVERRASEEHQRVELPQPTCQPRPGCSVLLDPLDKRSLGLLRLSQDQGRLLRALLSLPGVALSAPTSAQLCVRCGAPGYSDDSAPSTPPPPVIYRRCYSRPAALRQQYCAGMCTAPTTTSMMTTTTQLWHSFDSAAPHCRRGSRSLLASARCANRTKGEADGDDKLSSTCRSKEQLCAKQQEQGTMLANWNLK